jgi:hypothetical protein
MLGQGEIGVLSTVDLNDWRELEGELSAIDQCPDGWSARERKQLHIRRLVLMACFYDAYGLDRTKMFDFNPVTGSITESFLDVTFTAGDEA